MVGDTPDAQRNEDPVSSMEFGLLKLRQKNAQDKSVLCCGKWLQIGKNSPKVSCEVSDILSNIGENHEAESRIESHQSQKVICLSSKTFSSPPCRDYSQGSLQVHNGGSRFVYQLENQKDIYVASNIEDQSVFMIYLQKGDSSTSNLVGKLRVSTKFSERIIEKEFVLFSGNDQEILCKKKNRGFSSLRCFRDEQFNEPSFKNNLSSNFETLAVVVKQEVPEKENGGWGLKFLKKSRFNDATKTGTDLISMNVVIPSGIHGGPKDGPLSLIERWKSQGSCDCGGWDLGCSLTLLKGQLQKDHFELSIEGSKRETLGLRIVNVRGGLYFVQHEKNLSALQSFSTAIAFIHSQKIRL